MLEVEEEEELLLLLRQLTRLCSFASMSKYLVPENVQGGGVLVTR